MSKRRKSGEVVIRRPGSCYLGSAEPKLVKLLGDDTEKCMLGCGDKGCREWLNVEVVNGEHQGSYLYHLSECEMIDP